MGTRVYNNENVLSLRLNLAVRELLKKRADQEGLRPRQVAQNILAEYAKKAKA